ncbi:FG-GAP-like repeat-containing protein [Isosphaeraceae bacterium EP7]
MAFMSHRRCFWFVGSAVVIAAWGAAHAYDAWRFRSDFEAAKEAISQRSTGRALELLERASARHPGDGEVRFLIGACEQALGRPEAAAASWARVDAASPFAPSAAMLAARLALARDRLAEAEPLLVKALGGQGKLAVEARETLVNLYKIQGRFIEARAVVSGAWGTYPDPMGLLKELENLGSTSPMSVGVAHAALEKASRNAPEDDRIWLGLANLATRTGRFDEAKRRLEACLRRRPDDPAAWRGWFNWALATQDEAEVVRALRHLPEDAVPPPEILTLQAWFASRAGDLARERRAHQGMIDREPGNLLSLARLADLALAAGESDTAAKLRERRGELSRVMYLYERALQNLIPLDVPEAARQAEALGRFFEAHSLWSIVARREPGNAEARGAMARLKTLDDRRPPGPFLRDLLAELDAAPKANRPARPVSPGVTPEFEDDAEAVGLQFAFANGASSLHHLPETTAGGVGMLDYDGDGWLDVYLTQAGSFPPDLGSPQTSGDRLFRNRGDGTFEDATGSSGLSAFARGYGHGVTVGDFDNDGRPDLFVTRWRRYALYRNKGDGTFEDRTEGAGLGGDRDWPTSAAFADLDNDGDLDLYVCHYLAWDTQDPTPCWDEMRKRYSYCAPQHFRPLPDHLFRNDGGQFVDVSAEAGIVDTDGRGLGVVAADLDGDGRVDLYVANDQSANFLFRNLGGMRFEDIGQESGVASSGDGSFQASMGIACGDADGDGLPDLAVTNFFNESTTLYRNRGQGIFADATAEAGLAAATRHRLGFGAAFLDANNDGRLDLATANGHVDDFRPEIPYQMPAQLLIGVSGGRFVDATAAAGAPWQVPRVARGLAVGDLDNDGRPDLLIHALDSRLAYFHNRTAGGHWLTVGLEGAASHRDAVGARVEVVAGGQRSVAWRIGGGSFQSASDPRLHFGLGDAGLVERIEVTWPSGRVDRFGPIPADAGYRLREGHGTPEPLPGFRTAGMARIAGDAGPGASSEAAPLGNVAIPSPPRAVP